MAIGPTCLQCPALWADTVVLLHQGRLLGPFTREVFFGTNGAHQLLYGPESSTVGAGSEVDLI
jgi:hypothetical protein